MENKSSTSLRLLYIAVITVTVACFSFVYSDIIHHEFLHWDDVFYVANNPYLHEISFENFIWMITDYKMVNWHPVTWLSYSIDYAFWGNSPVMMKLSNIVIHLACCVVLYYLFCSILEILSRNHSRHSSDQIVSQENKLASLFAACLYGIHPQHIESVIWIAERKDVLCGLFYFSCLHFYLKYNQIQSRKYLNITYILALLATMSKPMAVSIPFILMVFDILLLNKTPATNGILNNVKILVINKLVLILLSVFIAGLTIFTQAGTIKDLDVLNPLTRIINASQAFLHYLYTIIWPVNLTPFYPFGEISTQPGLPSIFPVLGVVMIFGLSIYLYKKGNKLFLLALIFYSVSVAPVIGLVSVGDQAYADRYSYIPTSLFYIVLVNSIIAFVYKIRNVTKVKLAAAVPVSMISLVLIFSTVGYSQAQNWRNDKTLWLSVISNYPGKVPKAYQNLGNSYYLEGKYQQAIEQYELAIQVNPDSSKIYENLGKAHSRLGNSEKEIYYYNVAIEKDQNAVWPRLLAGYYYFNRKNLELTQKHFRQAMLLAPTSEPVIIANVELDIVSGRTDEAKERLLKLLDREPDYTVALSMISQIYYAEGDIDKTRFYLQRLIQLEPKNKTARKLNAKLAGL